MLMKNGYHTIRGEVKKSVNEKRYDKIETLTNYVMGNYRIKNEWHAFNIAEFLCEIPASIRWSIIEKVRKKDENGLSLLQKSNKFYNKCVEDVKSSHLQQIRQ